MAFTSVALDHKAFDVAIFDMRNLVDYTDYFVLCTARNRRHVAAVAEALRLYAKRMRSDGERRPVPSEGGPPPVEGGEVPCLGIEGLPSARWALLDFGTVVVHVFDEPMRAFYNLDGLWSDAPRLQVPESAPSFASDDADDDADEPEVELGR